MIEPVDLASLATLNALLQEASVTKAAQRLGLSAPAVSHALARLRTRLGDPLLVRAGRIMVLTPRALALRPVVEEAVAAAGRVFEREEEFSPERMQRVLTISVTDYVLVVFGGGLDAALRDAAPGLDIRFIPNAVDDAQRLRVGETDLAIGIYGDLPPELKTRPIITDRLVCVVREDHPTVRRRLTLEQFRALQHIQVAPRGRPGGYVDEVLAERGFSRRVARAVPYFQVALEMTAQSDRLLTVSERIVRKLAPALKLRVFDPPLPLDPFTLSMVWHPRFDADPGHRWVRERLVDVTKGQDAMAYRQARRRDPTASPGRH